LQCNTCRLGCEAELHLAALELWLQHPCTVSSAMPTDAVKHTTFSLLRVPDTLTACALLLPLPLLPLLLLLLQPPGQHHCWQLHCPPVSQPWHDGAHSLRNGQITLN
jgi:hypothetical protein